MDRSQCVIIKVREHTYLYAMVGSSVKLGYLCSHKRRSGKRRSVNFSLFTFWAISAGPLSLANALLSIQIKISVTRTVWQTLASFVVKLVTVWTPPTFATDTNALNAEAVPGTRGIGTVSWKRNKNTFKGHSKMTSHKNITFLTPFPCVKHLSLFCK